MNYLQWTDKSNPSLTMRVIDDNSVTIIIRTLFVMLQNMYRQQASRLITPIIVKSYFLIST